MVRAAVTMPRPHGGTTQVTAPAENQVTAAGAADAKADRGKGNFLTDWVVPIVLGIAIGTGAVWAWPRVMHKPARRIVAAWRNAEPTDMTDYPKALQDLGSGARDDV